MQTSFNLSVLALLAQNIYFRQCVETLSPNGTQLNLTRKKRFLVFPEGSSLQLVYCLTIPSLGMGNIFTIGWTAALAWELPSEPLHLLGKKLGKLGNPKRVDKKPESALKYGGWNVKASGTSDYNFLAPSSYSTINRLLSNNGYSRLHYGGKPGTNYREYFKGKYVDYHPVYDVWSIRMPLKQVGPTKPAGTRPLHHEIHRRTRRDLFSKIEKFLDAQRQDGKACILKAICEVGNSPDKVETFMEEMIKAIFRMKPYRNSRDGDEFDIAAEAGHNCTDKYPRCSSSVWNMF